MRDWDEIRRAYAAGESLCSLARRFDIPYSTLCNRAVKEDWDRGREGELAPTAGETELKRIGRKLLNRIESCLDRADEIDLKELKTMTGALKELQSLQEDPERGEGGRTLTVRFAGETEEMSR